MPDGRSAKQRRYARKAGPDDLVPELPLRHVDVGTAGFTAVADAGALRTRTMLVIRIQSRARGIRMNR